MESDTVKEREFNIQNIIEHKELIDIINRYEQIKKTIRYEAIQQQIENMKRLTTSKRLTPVFLILDFTNV